MDLKTNKYEIEILIDSLNKSKQHYKKRLIEMNYSDEYLSEKLDRIDNLLEKLRNISLNCIY